MAGLKDLVATAGAALASAAVAAASKSSSGGSSGGGAAGGGAPVGSGAETHLNTYGDTANALKAQMQQNSILWGKTDSAAEKEALHQKNVELANQLKAMGGTVNFDPHTGKWFGTAGEAPASGSSGDVYRGSGSYGGYGGGAFSYGEAPQYVNRYQGQIDALTQQILNRAAFSYDPEKDPTYQQYKVDYTRAGQRAMQDTQAQIAARTGGLASSYAGSASQQTYDNYMSALAAKIPELRQAAYNMYVDEGNRMLRELNMLQGLEQSDYAKYADALGQYNTDRGFQYGVFRDGIGDAQWQRQFDYNAGRDLVADQRYAAQFGYNAARDLVSDQRYMQEYADSRSDTEYKRAKDKAETLAATGDFSGYKALGYSDAEIAGMKARYDAPKALAVGGVGYGDGRTADNMETGGESGPGPGINDSRFTQAMNALSWMMAQGKTDYAEGAINNLWSELNKIQRDQVQEILGGYGKQFREDKVQNK